MASACAPFAPTPARKARTLPVVGRAVAQDRLARPRAHPPVGGAAPRMAADAARGVAAATRPVLGGEHVRHRLGGHLSPLRAAARPRGHARRAVGPDLGNAGRARHVARLRDGRRSSPAAAGCAGPSRRGTARGGRRSGLRDLAHRRRRRLGRGGGFAAECDRRACRGRRAHRRGQRPAGHARPPAAGAAGASGRHQGGTHAGGEGSAANRATWW